MRRSTGFYRRLALIALANDAVRVGLSLLALVALALAGLPPLPTVSLPLFGYVGLRLLSAPAHRPSDDRTRPATRSADEAYAACVGVARTLTVCAGRLEDAPSAALLRRIAAHLDRSLEAIAADGVPQASVGLLGLAQTTDRLVTAYLKVAGRGFDDAEMRERLRVNLAALEREHERLWIRLNRAAIVDLEALGATIDFTLDELGPVSRLGATS